MNTVLFLCTGNYYRSRFAEYYFQHQAAKLQLNWQADSRGLDPSPHNVGPLSRYTLAECERLEIPLPQTLRMPITARESDFHAAQLIVAVKEAEHRPLMQRLLPTWEHRVEYWTVHDLDCATAEQSLPALRELIDKLIVRLQLGTAAK